MFQFLKNNCINLQELIVYNSPRDQFLKLILNDMKNLEKFEFGMKLLPECVEYFDILNPNYKLKTLILRGELNSLETVEKILKNYRGLKTLEILDLEFKMNDLSDILITVTENNKNIEHLTLNSLSGTISPLTDLKYLKSLKVQYLKDESETLNLTYLVIYSENIKKLQIKNVYNCHMSNINIFQIVSKAKNLEELDFGKRFEFEDQALNIIKNTAKKLKKFTIYTSNIDQMNLMIGRIHNDGLQCFIFKGHNDESDNFDDFEATKSYGFNNISNYDEYVRASIRRFRDFGFTCCPPPLRRIRNFNNEEVPRKQNRMF